MSQAQGKKRGPAGLANSKAKKQKRDAAVAAEDAQTTEATLDSDTRTVALPDDIDEDDEVGQLVALYGTAVELLHKSRLDEAHSMFNGTVHEADRILRNAKEPEKMSFDFHRVYAGALLELSLHVDDESAKEGEKSWNYVTTALERCETGLRLGTGQGQQALKLTLARCICRDVSSQNKSNESRGPVISELQRAMKLFDGAFKASLYVPLQLQEVIATVQEFADSLSFDNDERVEMNEWAEKMWTKVLAEQQENVSALEGCGRVWLSLAQPKLAILEEEEEEAENKASSTEPNTELVESVRKSLETAVELLTQAVKCAEKSDRLRGDLLCLLAEATIGLANTFEEGAHYDKLEGESVSLLKRADALPGFELPTEFREMIDSNDEENTSEAPV